VAADMVLDALPATLFFTMGMKMDGAVMPSVGVGTAQMSTLAMRGAASAGVTGTAIAAIWLKSKPANANK